MKKIQILDKKGFFIGIANIIFLLIASFAAEKIYRNFPYDVLDDDISLFFRLRISLVILGGGLALLLRDTFKIS